MDLLQVIYKIISTAVMIFNVIASALRQLIDSIKAEGGAKP